MTTDPEHLRPVLHPRPAPQPTGEAAAQNRAVWLGGGLIAAVTFGAGAFFYTTHGTGQAPAHATATPTAPGAASAGPVANSITAAVQLSMLPPSEAAHALARSSFSPDQQAKILAAVQRGDMRLAQMPVLDASGRAGQILDITTAGMTQRIVLTGQFQTLTLPISAAGVAVLSPVTPPAPPALTVGAMTAFGPEVLPSLTALGQSIALNVIVQ